MVPPFCDTYSNIGIQVTQVSQGLDFLQELWAPQSFEEHLCCLRFDSMMYFVCVPDSSTLNTYSYMVRSKKSMIPGIFYLHWGGGTGINVGVCVVLHMYIIYIYIYTFGSETSLPPLQALLFQPPKGQNLSPRHAHSPPPQHQAAAFDVFQQLRPLGGEHDVLCPTGMRPPVLTTKLSDVTVQSGSQRASQLQHVRVHGETQGGGGEAFIYSVLRCI